MYTATVWGGRLDGEVISSDSTILLIPVQEDAGLWLAKSEAGTLPTELEYETYYLARSPVGNFYWVEEEIYNRLTKGQS